MADTKQNNVKSFSFTKEELDFLMPRQQILNQTAVINSDTKAVLDSYIINVVCKRVAMDPNKYQVNFDFAAGNISFVDKIVLPNGPIPKTTPTAKAAK